MSLSRPMVCVEDYEAEAARILSRSTLSYYRSGATKEFTLQENKKAINRWYLRPRVLCDVSQIDMSTKILGHKVSVPFGVAPTAMQKMAHPDGECANAKAAGNIGTAFTLSTISTCSIEEVSKAAPNTLKFFQLYIYKDRDITTSLVKRAEHGGYMALVLTVDAPSLGIRRADAKNMFTLPKHLRLANFQSDDDKSDLATKSAGGSGINEYVETLFDASLAWKDVAWLKQITHLPIVLKGILTAEDAKLGVNAGANAIWVSNHGARQVDGVTPTIDALNEVVKAVNGQCEIYVDGGFDHGPDILKAIAIGANMVFLGRPMLWGLACGGEQGASNILSIIKLELKSAMQCSGCATIDDITRDLVVHRDYYSRL